MKTLLAMLLATFLLSGCFIDVDGDGGILNCINGDGPIESREIDVPNFRAITLAMDARVILIQGDEQSVTVEGKPNIIDAIERDVSNGTWVIDSDRCLRDVGELTFYVTVTQLDKIKLNGSGDIRSDNVLLVQDLELVVSGSGDLDIALEGDDVDANLSGSGSLLLEGLADELDLDITGSGSTHAFGLETRQADVRITGSGDAQVQVSDWLKVRITGSGDVYYRGYPTLDVSVTGSGRVIDDN